MKILTTIVIGLLVITSCAKTPLIQASRIEKNEAKEKTEMPSKYDRESKLFYEVHHSDSLIHLHLMTADFFTKMKILRYGFNVYYDPTSKKSTSRGFQYPVENNLALNQIETAALTSSYETAEQEKIIKRLVDYQKVQRNVVLHLNEDGSQPNVKAFVKLIDRQLHYYASIPKSAFGDQQLNQLGKTTFGFQSGGIELSLKEEDDLNASASDEDWREYDHNKPFHFWISVEF